MEGDPRKPVIGVGWKPFRIAKGESNKKSWPVAYP